MTAQVRGKVDAPKNPDGPFGDEDRRKILDAASSIVTDRSYRIFISDEDRYVFFEIKDHLLVDIAPILSVVLNAGGGAVIWPAYRSTMKMAEIDRDMEKEKENIDLGTVPENLRIYSDATIINFHGIGTEILFIYIKYDINLGRAIDFMSEVYKKKIKWQENFVQNWRKKLVEYIESVATDQEIEDFMRVYIKNILRIQDKEGCLPRWGDKDLPDTLNSLSAPLFFKQVYGRFFGKLAIDRAIIREFDNTLMALVEQYIGKRNRRHKDLGDAEGISFLPAKGRKRGRRPSTRTSETEGDPNRPASPAQRGTTQAPRRRPS